LRSVLDNLKGLEGLDISGCFSIDLGCLTKLKGNQILRCLLLEYLLLKPDHLKPLQDTQIGTLSVFYAKSVNFTHLEMIKGIRSLTNLNIQDCPQVTEPCKSIKFFLNLK
jgi:hypothetical protein